MIIFEAVLSSVLHTPARPCRIDLSPVDTQASINRAAEITLSSIERAKRILDQNDPRKLKSGARRTISVRQSDLDLAAYYLARQYAAGGARVQLQRGLVNIAASLRLPLIPLPIYLNLDALLVEDGALPRIESLRLGKVPSRRRWRIG